MEDRRVLKSVKGGVQGRINEAVENLTMFSKECSVDVEEMQLQLMQTSNTVRERQRAVQEQSAKMMQLKADLEKT